MEYKTPIRKSVSVIIPTFNGESLLRRYLPSVIQTLRESNNVSDYEIIVADDCSTDGTIDYLTSIQQPKLRWITSNQNRGFSQNCNKGIEAAGMELTLLLNNDMVLNADFFDTTIPYFSDEKVFGINCEIRDPQGEKILEAAKAPAFKHGEIRYQDIQPQTECSNTFYLCGGNALVDTEKLKKLNGFNELFSPFYFEDFDLSLRAWRSGWKCLYTSRTFCKHCHSATIGSFPKREVEIIFLRNRMLLNYLHNTDWKNTLFLLRLRVKTLLYSIFKSDSHETAQKAIRCFFELKKAAEKTRGENYRNLVSLKETISFFQN